AASGARRHTRRSYPTDTAPISSSRLTDPINARSAAVRRTYSARPYTAFASFISSVVSSSSVFKGCPAPAGRSAPKINAVDHVPRVRNTDAPKRSNASCTWEPPAAAKCPNHAPALHSRPGFQLTVVAYESSRTGSKLVRSSSACAALNDDASTRRRRVKTPTVTTPQVVWVTSWV